MTNAGKMTVQVLKYSRENLAQSKDEEYAYWQSRPPIERLAAMQELSFAFHEGRAMKLRLGADFGDILAAFRACNVKYLIIRGPGVQFGACWAKRVEVPLDAEGAIFANIISADDLIASKIASGREQDLADVQAIRRAQNQKPKT